MALGSSLHGKVVSLAGRLAPIWADKATTDAQRKGLLRCLVDKVVLDRGEHDIALVRIVWRGGAVTELEVKLRVNSVAKLTRGTEIYRKPVPLEFVMRSPRSDPFDGPDVTRLWVFARDGIKNLTAPVFERIETRYVRQRTFHSYDMTLSLYELAEPSEHTPQPVSGAG